MADGGEAGETYRIRPFGAAQDDVVEVAERANEPIRPFRADAYGDVVEYRPKTVDEASLLHKLRADVRNRHIATNVGLGVIAAVTLEHFPTKWIPVRRRKCGKIKNLEQRPIAT